MSKQALIPSYGRRRSRSLGALPPSEICKNIDKSLPSAERLKLLVQYTLENSISRASGELLDDVDPDEFQRKVAKCIVDIETAIEEEDLYNLATSEKEARANLALRGYTLSLKKFEKESEKWDELLAKSRLELEQEIARSSIPFEGSIDRKILDKYDLSNMLEEMSNLEGIINYQMLQIKEDITALDACKKSTVDYVDNLHNEIANYLSKFYQDLPKVLIKKACKEGSGK